MNRADIALAVFFILAAACFSFCWYLLGSSEIEESAYVLVKINGKLDHELPLDTDTLYKIEQSGIEMTLQIRDKSAVILESNCPDKSCVRQGAIRHSRQTIVCLPNRTAIELAGIEFEDIDIILK